MSTYDVTVTLTIEAMHPTEAMILVSDTISGISRHPIQDVSFENVTKVKI
jgi:hypothetical protein